MMIPAPEAVEDEDKALSKQDDQDRFYGEAIFDPCDWACNRQEVKRGEQKKQ